MDGRVIPMDELAKLKDAYRKRQAALSFEEKIHILVQMQERRAPILAARGITQRVWRLDPPQPVILKP
jgi:hypothetical protein